MILNEGDIVKHFKGKDLIEKNIYEIVSIDPKYTGTKEFTEEPVVVYKSIFQGGKSFVRELSDLVLELSEDEKEQYGQENRINILTDEELKTIKDKEFIEKKLAYISLKYGEETLPNSANIVWKLK